MFSYSSTPGTVQMYQAAIAVEIWEGYVLRSSSDIARTLCTYSLDNGPLQESTDGYLLFRFTEFDWQNSLEAMLTQQNIHYAMVERRGIDPFEQFCKKNIYIAEDDEEMAEALSSGLQEAGYRVRTTASGKEILEGRFSSVDLFILGKEMRDADGLNICRHLRLQSATKDIPVIIISEQPHTVEEALLAGASDFIKKPFQLHYLLNVVSRYVKRTG